MQSAPLSKKAGKTKAGKGGKSNGGSEDEEGGDSPFDVEELVNRMDKDMAKALDYVQKGYSKLHAGRATPTMLDSLQVNSNGENVPLPSVGKVLLQGSNVLQVSLFEISVAPAVLKAIEASDLNLAAEVVGKAIKVTVPRPSKEAREALVKQVRQAAESGKVTLRGIRQKTMKKLKSGDLPKDDHKRAEKSIEKQVEAVVSKLDAVTEAKVKELLTV